MRLPERVLRLFILVKRILKVRRVEEHVINVELNLAVVPIHPPNMKLLGPLGILEFGDGLLDGVPNGFPLITTAPSHIGQENTPVVLNDIDLTVPGPFPGDPQRPEGRPETEPRINSAAHFETAVLPTVQTLGGQACRRVLGILPVFRPILAARLE